MRTSIDMPFRHQPEIVLFGFVWILSSLCGLAAMLRNGGEITRRMVWMSLLNSEFFGLAVALWLHDQLPIPKLLAVSIFAGLGGMSLIEFFFQKVRSKFK